MQEKTELLRECKVGIYIDINVICKERRLFKESISTLDQNGADILMQPVFIVAPVRSGSTLLHLMMDSHTNMANPGECDFLFDRVADDGTLPNIEFFHEWLETNRYFLAMNLTIDFSMGYTDLINSFVSQMQRGKRVIAMNVHHHFYRIPYIFPDAKYIHLLRDGRDVARSCVGMGWAGSVYYGVDIWHEAEVAWDRLKTTLHSSQYLEIKYEELLENVEHGLTQICQFVGLDYSASMLEYAANSSYSLPDKKLSYQWKRKYSKRELSLVENKVGHLLIGRGYELSGGEMSEPGYAEKLSLFFQNKWHRAKWQIGMYGFPLYLKYYIAKKIGLYQWEKSLEVSVNAAVAKVLK